MKYAIIGSRDYKNYEQFKATLDANYKDITEIISGGARGADSMAERYAKEHGIPTQVLVPDWEQYGKAAGHIRNTDIISAADVVVAYWDGISKGTKDSLRKAQAAGKPFFIHLTKS